MFLKRNKDIPDDAIKITTVYTNRFLLKNNLYISPNCKVDKEYHRYLNRLTIESNPTFLLRLICAIFLAVTFSMCFCLQLILKGKDAFDWSTYRDIELIDVLIDGVFETNIYNGQYDTMFIMSPMEIPKSKYKSYYRNAMKIMSGRNTEGLINDSVNGIAILAMEKSGVELNEYWLNVKKRLREQTNND